MNKEEMVLVERRRPVKAWSLALAREFPTAILTAIVTLILAIVLSLLLGQANTEHRIASRCNAFHIQEMIFELADRLGEPLDRTAFPRLQMAGIDCSLVEEGLVHPSGEY